MSLAATLRPSNLPFGATLSGSLYAHVSDGHANASADQSYQNESAYIALTRKLRRLQDLILYLPPPSSSSGLPSVPFLNENTPGAPRDTEDNHLTPLQQRIQLELYDPLPYHRTKWLHSIESARTLLLQLDRTVNGIKNQRVKKDALRDLSEKRALIKKLKAKVEAIGRAVENLGENRAARNWEARQTSTSGNRSAGEFEQVKWESVETILGRPLRPKNATIPNPPNAPNAEITPVSPTSKISDSSVSRNVDEERQRTALFGPAIRHRGQHSTSPAGSLSPSTEEPSQGKTSGFSDLQNTERQLASSERMNETLTSDLVNMTLQLKQQARNLQFSLSQDKDLLSRAAEGLERNVSGMELASRNMAFLKRMSEGEGWWGRLKLYAMIFGMWVAAILLVFVMPKLRF